MLSFVPATLKVPPLVPHNILPYPSQGCFLGTVVLLGLPRVLPSYCVRRNCEATGEARPTTKLPLVTSSFSERLDLLNQLLLFLHMMGGGRGDGVN